MDYVANGAADGPGSRSNATVAHLLLPDFVRHQGGALHRTFCAQSAVRKRNHTLWDAWPGRRRGAGGIMRGALEAAAPARMHLERCVGGWRPRSAGRIASAGPARRVW